MNLCIPIESDNGLKSLVCPHFGAAPAFLILDTDTGTHRVVTNTNQHHGHGMCMPLQTLQGQSIDAMVVGGIGRGALFKLAAANIEVYRSEHPTVGQILTAFRAQSLHLMDPSMACAQHGHS